MLTGDDFMYICKIMRSMRQSYERVVTFVWLFNSPPAQGFITSPPNKAAEGGEGLSRIYASRQGVQVVSL